MKNAYIFHGFLLHFRSGSRRQLSTVWPNVHWNPTIPQPATAKLWPSLDVSRRERQPHAADHVGELCSTQQEPHQCLDGVRSVSAHAGYHRGGQPERTVPSTCVSLQIRFLLVFFFSPPQIMRTRMPVVLSVGFGCIVICFPIGWWGSVIFLACGEISHRCVWTELVDATWVYIYVRRVWTCAVSYDSVHSEVTEQLTGHHNTVQYN